MSKQDRDKNGDKKNQASFGEPVKAAQQATTVVATVVEPPGSPSYGPVTSSGPTTELVAAAPAGAVAAANGHGEGLTGFDALSEEDLEFALENDGLADVDADDYRIPLWTFNVARDVTDPDTGEKSRSRKDQFINVLTEKLLDVLHVIMLLMKKSRSWGVFDQQADRTVNFCQSNDLVHGKMLVDHPVLPLKAGTVRPCEGCPQQEWKTEMDTNSGAKRRSVACNLRYNVIFKEMESGQLGMLRFQKTSQAPFKQTLQKYFLRQQKRLDKRTGTMTLGNFPLYSFVMKIALQMDTKSKAAQFCRPVFEKERMLSKVEIQEASHQTKFLADQLDKTLVEADKQESRVKPADDGEAASGGDTDFDPSKMDAESAAGGTKVNAEGEF